MLIKQHQWHKIENNFLIVENMYFNNMHNKIPICKKYIKIIYFHQMLTAIISE